MSNDNATARTPSYKLASAIADELEAVIGGNVEVKFREATLGTRVSETVNVYGKYEYWELTYQQAVDIICGAPMPKGEKYP